MSGRTVWYSKDAGWWRREGITTLIDEFGPVGPAVVDWLEGEAKLQNRGGDVKTGYRTIARAIGSDAVTVRNVVSRAITERVLTNASDDERILKGHLLWWEADQDKAANASRQARYRDKKSDEQREVVAEVTLSNGVSRPVDASNEDRTGQDREEAKASSTRESSAVREARLATEIDRAACRRFYELCRKRNPMLDVPKGGSEKWATALGSMRKLREIDKRSSIDVDRLIEWLFTDHNKDAVFWGTTIQSPAKLRDKFSQAWSKMEAASSPIPLAPPKSSGRFAHFDKAAGL